ncbi:YwqG family protein [Ureibacillus composti]|nr:YwqG family protein [Ureibacillus composti]
MKDLQLLLNEYGLLHKESDILNAAKQSIKMIKEKVKEEEIPIGSSKLGGLPDLPQDWEFPKYKNGFHSFLGQLNLQEVKPFDVENILPSRGILYIFYDVIDQPWGFVEDEGCFKVLYFEGDEKELVRKEYPETSENYHPLPSFKVTFVNILTLPEFPENIELSDEDEENYSEMRYEMIQPSDLEGEYDPAHYMLGYPFSIQNDVFDEFNLNSEEAVLLLQLDSDEEDMGWLWGDSGIIYFGIDKRSLAKKQFGQVQFTLQCF